MRDLGASYVNIGNFYWDTHRLALALSSYEQARYYQEKVVKENPGVPQFESCLATTYNSIGIAQNALDNQKAARDAYQKALDHWDQALKFADGQNVNALRLRRAITLARLGGHASATGVATEALQRGSSRTDVLLSSARVFSLSSEAVRQDAKLPGSDQNRLAEQYACRAIELLRQAQTAGYFDNRARVNHLKKDTDLKPLRLREDFAKLVAELDDKRITKTD